MRCRLLFNYDWKLSYKLKVLSVVWSSVQNQQKLQCSLYQFSLSLLALFTSNTGCGGDGGFGANSLNLYPQPMVNPEM